MKLSKTMQNELNKLTNHCAKWGRMKFAGGVGRTQQALFNKGLIVITKTDEGSFYSIPKNDSLKECRIARGFAKNIYELIGQ